MTFQAGAKAVIVDVVVSDSKGHLIPGLKVDNFVVTEDGSSQKLSFFEEHIAGRNSTAAPSTVQVARNVFTNAGGTSQTDSATLILFDMLNTPVQDQSTARSALIRYIKNKPKNESLALCVYSGPLQLVRGFTKDQADLLAGMSDRRIQPRAPLISELDRASLAFIRSVTRKLDNPNDLARTFAIAMAGLERSIRDEQHSQNDMRTYMTIAAFEELARYMAGIPGRKKILWLSTAFPLLTFASRADGLDAGPFHQQRNFLPFVSKTMNLLASAHVSVFPVDIRGVATSAIYDMAEEAPFGQSLPNSPLTSPSGTGQQMQAGGSGIGASQAAGARNMANDHMAPVDGFVGRGMEDATRRISEHAAMDLVAEQTGGTAFYGTNDITSAVRSVVEQGAAYYTLSYTPSNRNYDGRFRKIEVKVPGKRYILAHRSGYYAEDPDRLPEKTEAVLRSLSLAGMMHGAPDSRQIVFEVRLTPVGEPRNVNASAVGIVKESDHSPAELRLQRYRVDYNIDGAMLRFDPGPEGYFHGRLRLLANSFDGEGQGLLEAASSAVADLKPESYERILSDGLRLHQEINVPVGAKFLKLGVGDLASSYIGTLELPLPVPAEPNLGNPQSQLIQ